MDWCKARMPKNHGRAKQRARLLAVWPKAMVVYLNSTLGIVSILGARIPNVLSYAKFSLEENPAPH